MALKQGFQILDENNEPISMNELDKQVCELVGVEPDKKWYCKLGKREDYSSRMDYVMNAQNWYDTIGWMIAYEGRSFQQIIQYYIDTMKEFIGEIDEDGAVITIETIYPYHMKLLRFWIDKGYTAKQIVVE